MKRLSQDFGAFAEATENGSQLTRAGPLAVNRVVDEIDHFCQNHLRQRVVLFWPQAN
jgi:hypothetical protein